MGRHSVVFAYPIALLNGEVKAKGERLMRISGRNRQRLGVAILTGEEFTTYGALSGTKFPTSTGRLPHDWQEEFHAMRNDIDYAVMSYATPIAWHVKPRIGRGWNQFAQEWRDVVIRPEWVIPDVSYSVTTSKHQGIVRVALNGFPDNTYREKVRQ